MMLEHYAIVVRNSPVRMLLLAGHTHAMQFKIRNWSPSKYTYPEWGGMYSEGKQCLYVSTGVGENAVFRFGAYQQIVDITLRSN